MFNLADKRVGDPSPGEIRDACEEIRARWSRHKRRARLVEKTPHWSPPQVRCEVYWRSVDEDDSGFARIN